MGEKEIIKVLKKNKKYMTARQIHNNLNVSIGSVQKSLKQMRKYNKNIKVKKIKKKCGRTKYKRKVHVYKLR